MPAVLDTPRSTRRGDHSRKGVEKRRTGRPPTVPATLKADARAGRIPVASLLTDERAARVRVLSLLEVVRGCDLHLSLEALLVCQINGARTCGDLTSGERNALVTALQGLAAGKPSGTIRVLTDEPEPRDAELDRLILATRGLAPAVELKPSEFAAARTGMEVDPLLLRTMDRLVDALRQYEKEDVGGMLAHVVLEQFLRYRNYVPRVARNELPRPTLRSPAEVE